jgi:hypothetical protein
MEIKELQGIKSQSELVWKKLPDRDHVWLELEQACRERGDDPPVPVIGMGATSGGFGWDRHPYTVRLVSNDGKTIYVASDNVERTDKNGVSESQSYDYYESEDHIRPETWIEYTLRKNGRWVRSGEDMKKGSSLSLGVRNRWHNYSF